MIFDKEDDHVKSESFNTLKGSSFEAEYLKEKENV